MGWIANIDDMRVRPERSEIAAGVYHGALHAERFQGLDRAVDSITFCDTAEVNLNRGMSKADGVVREEFNCVSRLFVREKLRWLSMVTRKQADVLQYWSDRDVERAGGAPMKINRGFDNLKRP